MLRYLSRTYLEYMSNYYYKVTLRPRWKEKTIGRGTGNRWKVQRDQVLIGSVTKFLLVKDTLARNSNKHSPKNNSCTVIAKLNFTHLNLAFLKLSQGKCSCLNVNFHRTFICFIENIKLDIYILQYSPLN